MGANTDIVRETYGLTTDTSMDPTTDIVHYNFFMSCSIACRMCVTCFLWNLVEPLYQDHRTCPDREVVPVDRQFLLVVPVGGPCRWSL